MATSAPQTNFIPPALIPSNYTVSSLLGAPRFVGPLLFAVSFVTLGFKQVLFPELFSGMIDPNDNGFFGMLHFTNDLLRELAIRAFGFLMLVSGVIICASLLMENEALSVAAGHCCACCVICCCLLICAPRPFALSLPRVTRVLLRDSHFARHAYLVLALRHPPFPRTHNTHTHTGDHPTPCFFRRHSQTAYDYIHAWRPQLLGCRCYALPPGPARKKGAVAHSKPAVRRGNGGLLQKRGPDWLRGACSSDPVPKADGAALGRCTVSA